MSGRKSKLLWITSNSAARSKACAMWRHSLDLRLGLRILLVAARDDRGEPACCQRVAAREERHVDAARDEPLGEERGELLPRPVVSRRHAPRDRRQDRDAQARSRVGSGAAARAVRSSIGTTSSARACVAPSTTSGATPASCASSQRDAHRHQRSPGFTPSKPHSGRGVERSFPAARLNARNSSVITAQTVWLPRSSGPVAQHASRKKPVSGSARAWEQLAADDVHIGVTAHRARA